MGIFEPQRSYKHGSYKTNSVYTIRGPRGPLMCGALGTCLLCLYGDPVLPTIVSTSFHFRIRKSDE